MVLMQAACGDESGHRLRNQILERLPSTSSQMSVEESLQSMHSLAASDSFRMATANGQALVNVTTKWLGRVADERPPGFSDSAKDAALHPIIEKFQFFVKVEQSAGSNGKATVVFGLEALKILLEKAKEKHEDQGCTLADIRDFKVFSYLMPPAGVAELGSLLKDVEKGTNAMAEAKASKATKKTQKSTDAAVAEVMALFK